MTSAIVALAIAVSIQAEPKYTVTENQQFAIIPAVVQYSPVRVSTTEKENRMRVIDTSNTYVESGDSPRFCSGEMK